mgnify:CR=1 FL=1
MVSYADEVEDVLAAAKLLSKENIPCDVYKLVKIYPFTPELVSEISRYDVVLFAEECVACGGIGEHLETALRKAGWQVLISTVVWRMCVCPMRRFRRSSRAPAWMLNIWHRPSVHGKEQNLEDSFGSISGSAWSDPEP